MSRWVMRAGSLLLLATLAGPVAAASGTASGRSGGTTAKTPTRGASQVLLPRGRPLPDTVLALVGHGRTVSFDAFRRGWSQVAPPARPDSLTPQSARQFLDLLIDKELLAERAVEETWEWTSIESLGIQSLRDRTMMRTALDSALVDAARERAARGEPPLTTEMLGVAARESTVAHLGVTYDESVLGRLARGFAGIPQPTSKSPIWSQLRMMGTMPEIEPSDSVRVVAWSGVGTYKVADVLTAWRKLNPLQRPRVETVEQTRDVVKNGLYERVLRRSAEIHHLERHPRVVDAVAHQAEYLAVQHYVAREVYTGMPTDSLTLRRYYDRDPAVWGIPTRLQITRLVLPSRQEAMRMAVQLRDPAAAETLVARALRSGVDYNAEISALGDSVLFRQAMRSGTGTVLGPDTVSTGWQVVRVNAVRPPQGRSFSEVRDLVERAWGDEEGERRLQALLDTLRKHSRVVVNEPALARLTKAVTPAASGKGS